jgi:hypothetical protein
LATLRPWGRRAAAAWLAAFLVSVAAPGCRRTIRVNPVDYTLTDHTPIVMLPLGLPSPIDRRDAFAQVFCKALLADTTYGHKTCKTYLELEAFVPDDNPLPPLPDDYQVIVVAGIFSACLPRDQVSIFRQGIAQLRREGLTNVEEIQVSASGGTDEHAKTIADYISRHQDPKRPFIAIGYSQGAADLLEAYATDDVVRDSLKALITVAGAVGGSRLPDGIPRSLDAMLGAIDLKIPDCEIKTVGGLTALRREERYTFLTVHKDRLPRAYSVAAKSSEAKTSRILKKPWTHLTAYSIDEDSQVIRDDAVVPGGSYLATALADHWAVTLPFKEAHDPAFDRLVDQNDYPRTVLLEALVRYVMKDLREHP